MIDGICTLANDKVFDQVVALLNSIEANAGTDMPVCIYPYDNDIEKISALAAQRPHVEIFDDQDVIDRWDSWVKRIWATHPTARQRWPESLGQEEIHRLGTHRRFCAFDGPFERFIYMDADTLLLNSPDIIFQALESVDWATYDFQYKDIGHIFEISAPQLQQIFSDEQIKRQSFCSGFYGSKKEAFIETDLKRFLYLLTQGEAEILYPMAPDQTILNYFVMRKPLQSINLALELPVDQRTGNSVTSSHFERHENSLLDKGNKLLYLHYIGVSSKLFERLCRGENLNIPYRDIFLHYRYLFEPDMRPDLQGAIINLEPQKASIGKRFLKKFGLTR